MAGFLPNDLINITGAPVDADVLIIQQSGDSSVKKLTYGELIQSGLANGVCPLDGDALIPSVYLPAIAISNVYVTDNITTRNAISPIETGDTVKVIDSDGLGHPQTYIYDGTTFIDIQETSDVMSVNGATGTVVLTTANINASTNRNYVTDAELSNVQTIGTADNNVLTDAELVKVQAIGTTDHNYVTDVELAKLTALEGTDKRVLTDTQLSKLVALEGTDKRVLSDAELSKVQAIGTTNHNYVTDAELVNVQAIGTTNHNYVTDAELVKVQAIGTTDHNYVTDAQLTKVNKIESVATTAPVANSVTLDMGLYSQFAIDANDNFTLQNPTGLTSGQMGYIQITQDATGSRLLTLGTNYVTSGGVGITLTTTADATDVLRYEVLSATAILLTLIPNIS